MSIQHRISSTLLATMFITALFLSRQADALAAEQSDPLSRLHTASFYRQTDSLTLSLQGGIQLVCSGILGVFEGHGAEQELIAFGPGLSVDLSALPDGPAVLDLFAQFAALNPQASGPQVFDAGALYLRAAEGSAQRLSGTAAPGAKLSWEQLDPQTQSSLEEAYIQCYSDTWLDHSSMLPRDPRGLETYLAFWTQPAWEKSAVRYDLHVSADGAEISIDDYYRGSVMYQRPWAPEEGEADPAMRFQRISYDYAFEEASPEVLAAGQSAGHLKYWIMADFELRKPGDAIHVLSCPWLGLPQAFLMKQGEQSGAALKLSRGGAGISDWVLRLEGSFAAGQTYTLALQGECDVPASYSAVGYAGVYRFDTTALWPGEDSPVDIRITLETRPGWTYISSNAQRQQSYVGGTPAQSWEWDASTRNCMVVATQFPSREISDPWGRLTVFAPADLIDAVPEMGSVKAIGPVLSYFQQAWGPRTMNNGIADDRMPIAEQTVFLVPGESGVQAFEDAGLVFILGGEESYGGGSQALPVMAHELAHLWWGHGFSGPRWFMEGMANYASSKFLEHYYGPGGQAEGQGDPVGYRRYMINFALSHAMPLSLERRDSLDDSGAIYHNSAGFLLTADQRLPYGLDGPLGRFYAAGEYGTAVSHTELRGMFADQSELLGPLWDSYVERGEIAVSDSEDSSYRECVLTPEREKYVELLRWLVPMRRKAGIGDYPGAIYCARRALEFRSEPKDYLFLAELLFKSGDVKGARGLIEGGSAGTDRSTSVGVQVSWLLAQIYRAEGDAAAELEMLRHVIQEAPKLGLLKESEAAQSRLGELGQAP
ncbi:hypothetical protein IT575_05885 [bacterium]|nr:hypothetical protein [bacterium]